MDDWMDDANCTQHDPELFFPINRTAKDERRPREICYECPVALQCRDYAKRVHASHGIWAGQRLDTRGIE